MNQPPAEIGALIADIDTPALVVDLDALDRNIAKMAEFSRTTGVRVRPHAKKASDIDHHKVPLKRLSNTIQASLAGRPKA